MLVGRIFEQVLAIEERLDALDHCLDLGLNNGKVVDRVLAIEGRDRFADPVIKRGLDGVGNLWRWWRENPGVLLRMRWSWASVWNGWG